MSYQWPLDAAELFGERYPQMINTGLPVTDVDAVRAAITDMWPDAPGGWVYEWSKLGRSYAEAGSHQRAALAYGWAKFPTLAGEPQRVALANQLEQYLLAAPDFGVDFRREVLELPYQGGTTPVPVHLFAPFDRPADAPVVIASGGVDSWKMDMHLIFAGTAARLGVRVLAFDIPGTGESSVPMTADGGAEIVRGLAAHARTIGNGVVAHFGMAGIVGNAMGFDHPPSLEELFECRKRFSLRPLLDQDLNAPMLVINGANDVHVPQHDTLVFQGRRDTVVELIPGTGHCASSKLPQATATIAGWLEQTTAAGGRLPPQGRTRRTGRRLPGRGTTRRRGLPP